MSSHSFFTIIPHSLSELAEKIGAEIVFSDGQTDSAAIEISAAAPLEDALPGSVAFIDNRKYAKHLATTRASAVICEQRYVADLPPGTAGLVHDQPYRAYAAALDLIYPTAARPEAVTGETGISPKAHIGEGATLEEGVIVEAGAVIGRGVAMPSRAIAMAVASGPPMKIGSTRRSPSRSRRRTIGVFVGSSTRTPRSSISTIPTTLTDLRRAATLPV